VTMRRGFVLWAVAVLLAIAVAAMICLPWVLSALFGEPTTGDLP